MRVHNTTANTYGVIASVDSETVLTLDSDLCPGGTETFTVSNEVLIPGIETIMELKGTGKDIWTMSGKWKIRFYYG